VNGPIRSRLPRGLSVAVGLTILCIGLAAAPVEAQLLYGSVVGIIKDSTGARLPGATVTIVNKDTNLTREVVTDTEGAYNLVNVLPGRYDLKIALPGFREAVRSNVPVTIGERGIEKIHQIELSGEEKAMFERSFQSVKKTVDEIKPQVAA